MEQVTISPEGNIAIPKEIREALNLTEGAKLTLEVRGQEIVITKGQDWRKLRGAGGVDLITDFEKFKREEREREDSRS